MRKEAALTLGATRFQTLCADCFSPVLIPALLAGFGAALARGVGEYGSVIFIAGNMPMVSEIAPLLIVIRLEQLDYAGAAALGLLCCCRSLCCSGSIACKGVWPDWISVPELSWEP